MVKHDWEGISGMWPSTKIKVCTWSAAFSAWFASRLHLRSCRANKSINDLHNHCLHWCRENFGLQTFEKKANHGKSRKHLGHEANFFHPLGCRDIFWRCFASLFFRCLVFNLPWYSRCQVRSAWVGSMRPLHCPCHILTMSSGYRLGDLRDDWGRLWHWRPKWFNVAQLGSTESLSKFCLNPGYICYMLLLTIPPILMGKNGQFGLPCHAARRPSALTGGLWGRSKVQGCNHLQSQMWVMVISTNAI